MHYPTNILDSQTTTELLHFFDEHRFFLFSESAPLTFDGITDEALSLVAESNLYPLYPDTLRFLSPEAQKPLFQFRGCYLSFGGLQEISPNVASIPTEYPRRFLSLEGLTDPTPEVPSVLARLPHPVDAQRRQNPLGRNGYRIGRPSSRIQSPRVCSRAR